MLSLRGSFVSSCALVVLSSWWFELRVPSSGWWSSSRRCLPSGRQVVRVVCGGPGRGAKDADGRRRLPALPRSLRTREESAGESSPTVAPRGCSAMEEQGILSHLKLSCEAEGTFFTWLICKEKAVEGFQIKLTDAETAWAGEVLAEVLQTDATEAGLAVEDYADELLTALRGDPAYEVELQSVASSQSGVEKQLAVCKRHEDVTFELGVVPLHGMASAPSLARQMLACSLKRLATMNRDNAALSAENERLADERRTAVTRLEKYVQAKEEMERDLYGKFLMLLNEKKKKIQALSESLQKVEAERTDLSDAASAEEDGERQEYEESTEEDTPPQTPLDTPSCPNPPLEPGEKTLCLFGDKLEEMLAPTKRRRLKQPAVTRETGEERGSCISEHDDL